MNTTIMLMGDEQTFMMGFKGALDASGNSYDRFKSVEDLYSRVENHELKLLVVCYDSDEKTQNIVIDFVKKHPYFPILFVLPQDTEFEPKIKANIFRQIIRPLTKKSNFTSKLEDLKTLSLAVNVEKETPMLPSQFFDSIDLNAVIDKVFRHFSKSIQCKNIHWMLKEEFNRMLAAIHNNEEIEELQSFNRSVLLQSLTEVKQDDVYQLLKGFNVPINYFGKPFILDIDGENGKNFLVPIFGNIGKEVMAYLLFEGIDPENAGFLMEQVDETVQMISKHIGFSIDHWYAQGLSFIDNLTGLYNQKYLELVVQNEIARSQRQRQKFSVLFIDIDHFKKVNDVNGHWVGSKILIELGKDIKELLRSSDYAFRYGGDEFVVVLPETSQENGRIVAERLRAHIEKMVYKIDELELNITVSIGLAAYPDHASTHKEIIQMADEAMYCGKNLSRNIVYNAS